ncbi:MAG: pseudouridine synthase [Phycisphaerales bacterium]
MSSSPQDYRDKSRGIRLQKALADAGVASRRRCEELITLGEVRINGTLVNTLPAWVDPARDHIVVSGKKLPRPERHVYVMLYKPRGVVSTNDDPEGRTRAIDLVQHPSGVRLYPVGRLDMDSSGLVLLTNDGDLANRLTHPRYGVHKSYEVTVRGSLGVEDVAKLERGIVLYDKRSGSANRTQGISLSLQKRDRERTHLILELREGRNRQIRRMMADLGHPVKKLRRSRLGPLRLKGLAPGEWRELEPGELASLKRAASSQSTRESPSKTSRQTRRPAARKSGGRADTP